MYRILFSLMFFSNLLVAQSVEKLEKKLYDPKTSNEEKIKVDYLLGKQYKRREEYKNALIFFSKASEQDVIIHIKGKALLEQGIINNNLGRYEEAMSQLSKAAALFRELDSIILLSKVYSTMGRLNYSREDFKNSIKYHQLALDENRITGSKYDIGNSLNDLANVYKRLKDYDKSLKYLEDSYETVVTLEDSVIFSAIFSNMGEVYHYGKKEYDKALDYYKQSLNISEKKKRKKSIAITSLNIGYLHFNQGNFLDAEKWLLKSLEISESKNLLNLQTYIYEDLMELYEGWEKYDKALYHSQQLKIIRDSLIGLDKMRSQEALEVKFDVDRMEYDIKIHEQDKAIQEQWINALIIFSILSVLVLAAIIYSYVLTRKSNKKIKMLMREMHHRVKNNLQLLKSLFSIQADRAEDMATKELLIESNNRVQTMSLLHQRLYSGDNVSDVNLNEYVPKLLGEIVGAFDYNLKTLDLNVQVDLVSIDVEKAIPLALIINELITNSFKYAFADNEAPSLLLHLKRVADKQLQLTIRDNGRAKEEDIANSNSFGLKMVQQFCRQLKAELNTSVDKGVEYNIIIPSVNFK